MNLMAESFNFFNCLLDGERFNHLFEIRFLSYITHSRSFYHNTAYTSYRFRKDTDHSDKP